MDIRPNRLLNLLVLICSILSACQSNSTSNESKSKLQVEIHQITHGPEHHFFGYIGHVQNIPWNGSDRYILSLRIGFIDQMPTAKDAADIVLIDTENEYAVRKVTETSAWNPQQGSMMYWNPDAPETQFFFNDRDPENNHVFCVLFDIEKNKRIKEYRFEDTPFGNGGVMQNGGAFAGINYGRMARLRPVTGYPEAYDWNLEALHPSDDGIFKVDIASGEKELLVSFQQMRDLLIEDYPRVDTTPLFINHTLWNRDGDRLYFFLRGHFKRSPARINIPITVNADGSGLTEQRIFIGGHPEWEFGHKMIGNARDTTEEGATASSPQRLALYNSDHQVVIEELGNAEVFPDPENDVALSPDGNWIVQGIEDGSKNAYSVYHRPSGDWVHSPWFDQGAYDSGKLRIDAAPKWNRASNQVLFSSLTPGDKPTRQLFLMRIIAEDGKNH